MDSTRLSRDLQKILHVFQARGASAVIDGDTVAVLTAHRQRLPDGISNVCYDVHRVRTLTEAYIRFY